MGSSTFQPFDVSNGASLTLRVLECGGLTPPCHRRGCFKRSNLQRSGRFRRRGEASEHVAATFRAGSFQPFSSFLLPFAFSLFTFVFFLSPCPSPPRLGGHGFELCRKSGQHSAVSTPEGTLFQQNATATEFVCEKLLPEPSEITVELSRSRLSGQKVLCVVVDGHTGFLKSLCRAGFPQCLWDEFFEEMVLPPGKNSNLMEMLYHKADGFAHLLYAWTGLRTLPSKVKNRYVGKAFEAPTAKDVVNLFKPWVLGQ